MIIEHTLMTHGEHTLVRTTCKGSKTNYSKRAVYIVLDTSTSMGFTLPSVRQTVWTYIQQLPNGTFLRVSQFGNTVEEVCNESLGDDRTQVEHALYGLRCDGATNTHAALDDAVKAIDDRRHDEDTIVELHVFTDGAPTRGLGTHDMVTVDPSVVMEPLLHLPRKVLFVVYSIGTEVDHQFANRLAKAVPGGLVVPVDHDEQIARQWGAVNAGVQTLLFDKVSLETNPEAQLVLGDEHIYYFSEEQTYYSLWTGLEHIFGASEEEHLDIMFHITDDKLVKQWVHFAGFMAHLQKIDTLSDKPLALVELWREHTLERWGRLEDYPSMLRHLVYHKFCYLDLLEEHFGKVESRSVLKFLPVGLTRECSNYQHSYSELFRAAASLRPHRHIPQELQLPTLGSLGPDLGDSGEASPDLSGLITAPVS